MQYSLVNYKALNWELRIDAEYYKPVVLRNLSLLERKRSALLEDLADFIVGPFGSTVTVDKYVEKSNHRYIRNKDLMDFCILDDDPAYIPDALYNSLSQFHIKNKDLLVTVVGTLGKVAIARPKDSNSIFSCKSTIIRPHKINPYYLAAYLNSNIGQSFVLRGERGAIQTGLNLSDLKEIQVFIPSDNFQLLIRNILINSFNLTDSSIDLYQKSEQALLSELNLLNWKPRHQLSFSKNLSDTQNVDRIDAEYFQPMYDEIINNIKRLKNWSILGDLVTIKKCIEPGSEAYQEKGILFLRVSNLSKFGVKANNQQYLTDELYSKLRHHQPNKGEILLTKDATPGIAYHLKEEPEKMIPSGGILRLKVKDSKQLYPEYLTLVLNSVLVQKQIEKDTGGSVINHWRPDQVKNTLIPILKNDQQFEIKKLIDKSFHNRNVSKSLLNIAKNSVEIAIDKDEPTAEKWIKEELNKLNIKL